MAKKILIVDDDELIREEFKDLFIEEEYEVECAEDGLIALEKIEQQNFDFILSDIKMPNMNGVELVKKLKISKSLTPIVLMTGYSDYTESDLLNLGVSAVFFKPFDLDALLDTIKKLIL